MRRLMFIVGIPDLSILTWCEEETRKHSTTRRFPYTSKEKAQETVGGGKSGEILSCSVCGAKSTKPINCPSDPSVNSEPRGRSESGRYAPEVPILLRLRSGRIVYNTVTGSMVDSSDAISGFSSSAYGVGGLLPRDYGACCSWNQRCLRTKHA